MSFRSLFFALILSAAAGPLALAQSADLSVTKTGPALTTAGANVAYTVTITNNGPDDAPNATLTDSVPGGMSFVSENQTSGPAFSCTQPASGAVTGNVNCVLATMTSGSSATFAIVFQTDPASQPGTFFTNVASVSCAIDPTPDNDSAVATTQIPFPSQSDAGVSKSGPAAAAPGTDVVYSITFFNSGPDTATDLTFTDTLPGTMTFVSFVQNSGPAINPPCTTPAPGSGGTINCQPASFAPGSTATFTLTGNIPAATGSGTSFTNTATVTATGDPNPDNDSASVITVVSSVDLAVTKSGPATAAAASPLTYTLTVANNGPDAALNAILSDALPAGTTFVSLTQSTGPAASCSTPPAGANGSVTCSFLSIANGASAQFSLVINTGNTSSITNTATFSSTSFDTNSSNDTESVTTTVTQSADLAVTKTGPATVIAGSNVTYAVTATNSGPSTASTVSLTDVLPPGMTFVSAAQTLGPAFVCTTPPAGGTGTISCSIGSFAPGASSTFSFVMRVASSALTGSTVSNTANLSSSTGDPNAANNASTATATVTAVADVSVVKTGPAGVTTGSSATYTISVTNNGPSDAASVALSDAVPAQTTFVSLTQTGGPAFICATPAVGGTGTILCNIATLPAAGSSTFQFIVNVAGGATGTITNTANITSPTDSTPLNNASSATAPVVAGPTDVRISKTANGSTFAAGATVTYTLLVTNNGPVDAANTVVTDVLPLGTTFQSATPTQGSCSGTSTVTCTIGSLVTGASATITLVLTLPANPGVVTNTATVSIANTDPNPANNTSSATVVNGNLAAIPTLSPLALALLMLALAAVALRART